MPDWRKIKAEYIRTDISQRKIAEKYGVSLSSVARRCTKEKWADLRQQSDKKASAKIVESASASKAKGIDKIQTVADLLLNKIEEGVADGSLMVDSQSIRQITASIKDLRDIKGCKSELDMQEQLARIEKLRREASPEIQDNTIKVVIEGDLDDYA